MKRILHILSIFLLTACLLPAASVYGASVAMAQATGIDVTHQNGQTFVTWQETSLLMPAEAPSGKEFHGIKKTLTLNTAYRIYCSPTPILTLNGLYPMATVSSLSGWNQYAYGIHTETSDRLMHRYVISSTGAQLANGRGLWVHNPDRTGSVYYAVTAVINGKENRSLSAANAMTSPIAEGTGSGKPILQRIETPEYFLGVQKPVLYFYTRWEAPPNASVEGRAFDYLVGIPPKKIAPAPVGIHMHCWGGSQETGYTWWNDADDGAILLASNEDPYDWWTGYHERLLTPQPLKTADDWKSGTVHPYTSNRLFSFLYWMRWDSPWQIDLYRTFMAGSSMGGSGSLMNGIRNGERVAWVRSSVGVHVPAETTTMKSAYAAVWGAPENGVLFENGIPVWNYYDDVWFLRNNPGKETPFLAFSNAKNDPLIDWPQAVHFYQALQDTKRPHIFVWGQNGHSQMANMPLNGSEKTMPIDIRVNQSLPAFTRCSLDDAPGNGNPLDGAPMGQINGYLYWETADLIDTPQQWELTVGLTPGAPKEDCTVDITPRRLQQFKVSPGTLVKWESRDIPSGTVLASGSAFADKSGIVTLPQMTVTKSKIRVSLSK